MTSPTPPAREPTVEQQIAYMLRIRDDRNTMQAAILSTLRSAAELEAAAKMVILGNMTPDYIRLNINKSAWERLQKAVWPDAALRAASGDGK